MNLSEWIKHLSFWHNKSDDECIELATNEYGCINAEEALKNILERDFCTSVNNKVLEDLKKLKQNKNE